MKMTYICAFAVRIGAQVIHHEETTDLNEGGDGLAVVPGDTGSEVLPYSELSSLAYDNAWMGISSARR
jgi:hypothetical protein